MAAAGLVLAGCTGELDLDGLDPADASAEGGGSDGGGSGSTDGGGGSGNNSGGDGDSGSEDGGSGGDDDGGSGSSSDGGDNGGEPGRVSAFVAIGHQGRTTLSCDDGRSWIANSSADDSADCGSMDCNHGAFAGAGLAYGKGLFVVAFGWGTPGGIHYSSDGVNWQEGYDGDYFFADIAFGNDTFIAGDKYQGHGSTDGMTWARVTKPDLAVDTPRGIEFVDYDGGRFVLVADANDVRDIAYTTDEGQTWSNPTTRPDECVFSVRGMAAGNGTLVALTADGNLCTTEDGGETFTVRNLGSGTFDSQVVWTGTEFMLWSDSAVHRSSDGLSWTSEPFSPSSARIGAVAVSPGGTFVASSTSEVGWYDSQQFYRSTDGVSWDVLDSSDYVGSHRITFIEHGAVDPTSGGCSAP